MLAKLRFNTVVGKKVLMAVTGLAMVLFLIGHLVGNIQLLWSKDQFNAYAGFLTAQPVVIIIELGLLAIFLLHIVDALVLLKGNYNARPVPYHTKKWGRSKSNRSKKSWASTMMMWSGTAILLFVPFHVWQFKYHNPVGSPKTGDHNPNIVLFPGQPTVGQSSSGPGATKEAFDLAQLVVNELRNPFVAGIYILALTLLGLHLWHAISSAATSLGLNHPRYQKLIIWVGNIFTIVITGGFLSIPFLILLRVIK
jgi:succinate dehydrogenase / fumarate reductase, cytochrome b subunit